MGKSVSQACVGLTSTGGDMIAMATEGLTM